MKDLVIRALKTFAQSFVAVFLAGAVGIVDQDTFVALLIASVAAGLSGVQNSFIQARNTMREE